MDFHSKEYKSFYLHWNDRASIRNIPRRILQTDGQQQSWNFYPLSRQPLCAHPKILALGQKAVEYILIQSAYKFMHEIGVVEVDIINNIAVKIFNGKINFGFTAAMRNDTLAVIIDEAYHAYVANDFIQQVSEYTKIKPIKESRITQFAAAITAFKKRLSEQYNDAVDVIAICVGESTLTKELFDMSKEKDVHPLFKDIIDDHVMDEGRHQVLFKELFKLFWENLSEIDREILGAAIPEFLIDYLCPDMHIEYDKEVLKNLNLSNDDVEEIILDIYKERTLEAVSTRIDPITKNIMKMIEYANILKNELVFQKFSEFKFI